MALATDVVSDELARIYRLSQALSYQLVRQLSATTCEFLPGGKQAAFVDERASFRTLPTTSFHRGEAPLVDLERAHSHRRRFPSPDYTMCL